MSAAPAVVKPVVTINDSPTTESSELSSGNINKGEDTIMSKDERRRFKKLRKRAERFRPESDLSGIVKREEWEEAKTARMVLSAENDKEDSNNSNTGKDDFCPWIGLRQTKRRLQERDKVRDGIDHRMILKSMHLQQLQKPPEQQQTNSIAPSEGDRKRKREDAHRNVRFNIPAWASVHNPVCVDHLAVLELHVQGSQLTPEDIRSALAKTPTHEKNTTDYDSAVDDNELISTEWFQGPRPQSISDVLLYEKPALPPKKKAKQHNSATSNSNSNIPKLEETLQSLILTREEMKQEGYPSPVVAQPDNNNTSPPTVFRKPSSFTLEEAYNIVKQAHVSMADKEFPYVMDRSNKGSSESIRVYGLDCEMVKTDKGTELGRISLIQYTDSTVKRYQVVMEELVLPYRPILDYVTEYSGLTAGLLKDVTIRLEHIQASLLTCIRPEDILVGHSLENDLVATRWVHPTVIDTAVLFRSNASFKHSLKHLSNVLLKKKIQNGDHHCSEEDAAAALELAIGRAEEGPSFAIHPRDRRFWVPTAKNHNENATVFIGPSQWLQDHVLRHPNAIHALTCETIDSPNRKAICSWLTGPKRRAGLVWANLVLETPGHLKLLRGLLLDLRTKMSASTVLMVSTQQGHLQAREMSKRKRMCQNTRTTLSWSEGDEKAYQAAADKCRTGKVAWVTLHGGPNTVQANCGGGHDKEIVS